jgi:endo-1,4-beta-xylanase
MTTTTTLRETAARCHGKVYIGAAVLPRPLFVLDYDDVDDDVGGRRAATSGGVATAVVRPRIGCATISTVDRDDQTTTDTRYSRILSSEFNSVVIEHHLKWSPLVHALPGPISQSSPPETTLGRYDFRHVDSMVDWAISRNMHVKGHVLIWHVTSPPFLEDMSPDDVRYAVKRHIFTTMGYFRDRINMWDVVNEALASDGTLVENVFYRKMGPGYIGECFRWAHEADPNSFLIYNDNKVEGCGVGSDGGEGANGCLRAIAPNQAKSDGYYRLLKSLVDDGVPIHGAGMQAHLDSSGIGRNRPPTPSMVKRQIRRIGELGLKVNISEMDVRVSKSKDGVNRDAAQTCIYRDILSAALSESCFHGIWLWGFSDRHTWVKNFYHDDTPLIFDDAYERKMSYSGLEDALRSIACPNDGDGGYDGGAWYLESDYDEAGNEWGSDWMTPEPEPEEGEQSDSERNEKNGRDTTKDGLPDWLQPS